MEHERIICFKDICFRYMPIMNTDQKNIGYLEANQHSVDRKKHVAGYIIIVY